MRAAIGEAMAELGARHGVREALLFGSLAWGDFNARSDVDVLVFGVSTPDAIDLETNLSTRLRRTVHLIRAETASPSLVERVRRDGEVLRVA
jgi:predicted nucleotidyltransferase